MIKSIVKVVFCALGLFVYGSTYAQIAERERPKEWDHLVEGARFIDRFLPMQGKDLSADSWGAQCVLPRYVDNGIEDRIWSYWGGNITKGEDGLYHLFVCGWLEASPKGHMEWSNSYVFNAVSDNLTGPFRLRNMIGKGHNPEVYQLKDGRYVLYVIGGRYVSDNLNGKWEYGKFDFDARDRPIIEGLSNLSFAQREDGSYIMVCRGGGIWVSQDGLSTYHQLTDKRVYPDVDGRFEDPVIWKDHIQYHMIVNDWLGRIAYYLRSKDGVNWVVDPGEAYAPGIALHEDGRKEDWFKYERIKMFQDEYGRAVQANFAVIDTLKFEDKPFDTHSSKNIAIPLDPGLLLTIVDDKPINTKTKYIRVRIQAEEGFDPQADIDLSSLRFGASEEVNYGRGYKVLKTEEQGKDLIVTFDAEGKGIAKHEFAPKLIGKRKNGKMLYGYARLPHAEYVAPLLSARKPAFSSNGKSMDCELEIQNFGQVASVITSLKIEAVVDGKRQLLCNGAIPPLQPYEKTDLKLSCKKKIETIEDCEIITTIYSGKEILSTFRLKKGEKK